MARVLVVDDVRSLRDRLRELLQREGHEVYTAENSNEMLKHLRDHHFDVILADIISPYTSVTELLKTIREASPYIKIVIATSKPTVETAAEAVRAGAFDYLPKPISDKAVQRVVFGAVNVKHLEDIKRFLEEKNRKYQERLEKLVKERTKQINEYSQRLQHIAENTKNFTMFTDVEELAPSILGLLSKNMGADGGSLFLREDGELKLICALDPGHQIRSIKLPVPPRTVIGKVLKRKEAFVVRDITRDKTYRSSGWSGYENGSLLALPFQDAGGKIMGVATLHNKKVPPFTDQDLELGRIIASHSMEAIKNAELNRSLAESEKKYRLLSEKSLTGIFIHRHGLILYANPQMAAMLGFKKNEVDKFIGQSFSQFVHPEDRELVFLRASSRMKGDTPPDRYEIRLITRNKKTIWAELLVTMIDQEGQQAIMGNFIDITERKQAEEALRKREEEFRLTFENAKDAIFWAEPETGLITKCNKSAEELLEKNRNEIIGSSQTALHPPEKSDLSAQYFKNHVLQIGPPTMEMEIITKSGKIKPVTVTASLTTVAGKPIIQGIFHDITERKYAEKALRDSEEKYRSLVENLNVGVYRSTVDKQGRFLQVNPAMAAIFGYDSVEDLQSVPIREMYEKPDERAMLIHEAAKGIPFRDRETRMRKKDGSIIWVSISSQPTLDEKGRLKYFNGVIEDITERKKAEQALRESEEKYRLHFDNVSEVIYSIDSTFRFRSISPSVELLLGYKPEELIGKTYSEMNLLVPEYLDIALSHTKHVLSGNRIVSAVYEFIAKDGSKKFGEISSDPLIQNGEVVATISVARDITERKKAEQEKKMLEEQLIQAQKMEALGTLAGGIAHDFNNLLTGIMGNVAMAATDASKETRNYLLVVNDTAKRAADLIRQLLTFSRKTEPEFKAVDPTQIIEETLQILQETIDRRITVRTTILPDTWWIHADPGQVHQVAMNLCINARDAIMDILDDPADSAEDDPIPSFVISIELENMEIDRDYCTSHHEAQSGKYVVLTISDNGPGMDKQHLSRIYEPFFTTKEQGKGTGLGLSTVFGIVKQHDGWITVDSEIGQGTLFKIYLPKFEGVRPDEPVEKSTEDIPGGNETILLVDDEQFMRQLGQAILERKGYRVLLAEDGKKAIELFAKEKESIDLVILDLIMPSLSGKEVLKRIRYLAPGIRTILSSGYPISRKAEGFKDLGPFEFIGKPYEPLDLEKKVRDTLDAK